MKSSVDELSTSQKKALALFYETDAFKALEFLAKIEVNSLGKDALNSQEHSQTRYLAGRASMAVDLIKMIRLNAKETDKS